MCAELWPHFLDVVRQHRLMDAGDVVIVGVSGGPDSLALLHLLRRLRDEVMPSLRLISAHLNHRLRAEADADAAFVAALATGWGVEHVGDVADVPALRAAWRLSTEEAGRVARYGFLQRVAWQFGAGTVAVAHHGDDQVESVVMHWLRGAGLAGLRGMQPSCGLAELLRGSPIESAGPAVRLIRPLLACRRADIEAYCAEAGLTPRLDQTNLDVTIFRNRLRHELIPYLESYNPNIRGVLQRSAGVLARDYDYLYGQVQRAWDDLAWEPAAGVWEFDLHVWRDLHAAIQAGLLREAVRRLRVSLRNINEVHIDDALAVVADGHVGQRATLPQGLMLTLGHDCLWVADGAREPVEGAFPALPSRDSWVSVAAPGITDCGEGWRLVAAFGGREMLAGDWESNSDARRALLDADRLDTARLCLRTRRPGDIFCPLGMGGAHKDVREFMVNARVPRSARGRFPLVCAGDQIVWLPGLRLDERARVLPGSRRILALTMRRKGEEG